MNSVCKQSRFSRNACTFAQPKQLINFSLNRTSDTRQTAIYSAEIVIVMFQQGTWAT